MSHRSLGGAVSTVDLALSPKIDRDHPPDLKPLADGAAVVEAVKAAAAASPAAPASVKPAAKAAAKAADKLKTVAASGQPAALDLDRMVPSIVDRVSMCFVFVHASLSALPSGAVEIIPC